VRLATRGESPHTSCDAKTQMLGAWVPHKLDDMIRALAVVLGACLFACTLPTPESPSASTTGTAAIAPTVAPISSAATAGPTAVPPTIANTGLADFVRYTGRSDLRICLYVDPATGADRSQQLVLLSSTVDGLRARGYAVITAPPAECPQPTVFIRTNSVHPKMSGQGPVGTTPRVTTPDAFLLHVAITTSSQIIRIFGGLSTRRGAEEIACTGDNCGEITSAIYSDVADFQDPARREQLVLAGLGLLGPGN
jgi:hypothetical protein